MEAAAIEKLSALALLAHDRQLDTDTRAMVMPAGAQVVSLEHLMDYRARFRGAFITHSIPDFCRYVIDRKGQPRGFIDANNAGRLACEMIFNLGDEELPGHGDDKASLQLTPVACYAKIRSIQDNTLTQRGLIDWIEDWHSQMRAENESGGALTATQALAAIRRVTIERKASATQEQTHMATRRSAMEDVEAKASAESTPTLFIVTTEPYAGLGKMDFHLRLAVLTDKEEPRFTLRWMRREAQEEEIAEAFKQRLQQDLGGLCQLVLGSFAVGK